MKFYRWIFGGAFLIGSVAPAETLKKIEVQGHRGARAARPENTLPAFEYAINLGVDTLELDLAVSLDGELVISHEPEITPERCLDPAGKKLDAPIPIHTLNYADIKKYDCGSLPHEKFPRQVPVPKTPMPRLQDLFELVQQSKAPAAKNIKFNIETKIYPAKPELTPKPEEFARKIIALTKKYGLLSRISLQSFDDRTLRAARKIEPHLITVLLTSDNHVDYLAVAKSAKVQILSPDQHWILPEDVRLLHKAGIKVIPWTANEPADWDRLVEMGVDGIISDRPAELLEYLRAKGRH